MDFNKDLLKPFTFFANWRLYIFVFSIIYKKVPLCIYVCAYPCYNF